jgi:hypothetical protein
MNKSAGKAIGNKVGRHSPKGHIRSRRSKSEDLEMVFFDLRQLRRGDTLCQLSEFNTQVLKPTLTSHHLSLSRKLIHIS